MEIPRMGKVSVTAKVQNLRDLYSAEQGLIGESAIRSIEVSDALVDAGATMLSLPMALIGKLGLAKYRTRLVRTTAGIRESRVYEAVRLTIQDRECTADVADVPDDCPVLIGQIPLEGLDFVVDPVSRKLIGNPAHGGEHMLENY